MEDLKKLKGVSIIETRKDLRKRLPIRVQSIRDRAEQYDIDYTLIAERIARFKNVEDFQAWKNDITNPILKHIVERVGGNNYRYIRDTMTYIKGVWALY